MENEKSSVADFLNEFSDKKEEPFKEEVIVEEPVVEEEDTEEKPLPFHKDPKVQKYVDKQIAKALEGIKPTEVQKFEQAVSSDVEDVVGAFTTLIGNDTPEKVKALEALKKTLNGSDERASAKAIERFQEQVRQQEEQEQAADTAAIEELSSGFEQIEEQYGVDLENDRTTRAAFVEFLRKVSPKNAEGEVAQFADIPSTWETFQEINKRPTGQAARAKGLASRSLARSSDVAPKAPTGNSWRDVDKYFEQLKKSN